MTRASRQRSDRSRRRFLQSLAIAAAGSGIPLAIEARPREAVSPRLPVAADWQLVVLGITQDGGMPHPGCRQPPCSDARSGRRPAEKVACLGLVDRAGGSAYLFDATPDLPSQVDRLTRGRPPNGIFLTHAHIGHYAGLMYLGKEAWATRHVAVHGTRRMIEFLKANAPWSLLVGDGHIDPRLIEADRPVLLPAGVSVTPIAVPHREEFSDTVGFLIEGPRARALFVPDTDRWQAWSRSIRDLVDSVDYALLDGTFSSPGEIGGRDLSAIPHPMIPETRRLLAGTRARVWFIHLNHTNLALEGGADIAREGLRLPM